MLKRLYPLKEVPLPGDMDGFAPGCLQLQVTTHLTFWECVRVLLSQRLWTQVNVKCDVEVKRTAVMAVTQVLPP